MKLTTKVSQYILVVLLIHLFVLASIFFNVPILRQVMVFVYLTFFPGFLLLIALKVEKRDMLEIILLSVGLSIALVMFIGFMINNVVPNSGYFPTAINYSPNAYYERSDFGFVRCRLKWRYSAESKSNWISINRFNEWIRSSYSVDISSGTGNYRSNLQRFHSSASHYCSCAIVYFERTLYSFNPN